MCHTKPNIHVEFMHAQYVECSFLEFPERQSLKSVHQINNHIPGVKWHMPLDICNSEGTVDLCCTFSGHMKWPCLVCCLFMSLYILPAATFQMHAASGLSCNVSMCLVWIQRNLNFIFNSKAWQKSDKLKIEMTKCIWTRMITEP